MRGETAPGPPNGTGARDDGDTTPAPVQTAPLNAVALAKEVVLERLENLLEWLLRRLKRYRARRGDWWEK